MKEVSDFYKDLPFNYADSPSLYISNIRDTNQIFEYQDLHDLLTSLPKPQARQSQNILEMGCGTGWLSNSIAYHYKRNVFGIDFTAKALAMAESVSRGLGLGNTFERVDIFDFNCNQQFDLVVSLGVLHHTKDCRAAFNKAASFVRPGGHLYVGLYHKYSRLPMLQLMRSHSFWHGEEFAYDLFRGMSSDHSDRQLGMSWFRDQVLHPHETQHTIEELFSWCDDLGLEVISSSVNGYRPFDKVSPRETLIREEKELYNYSYEKNVRQLKFLPGYFTLKIHKSE